MTISFTETIRTIKVGGIATSNSNKVSPTDPSTDMADTRPAHGRVRTPSNAPPEATVRITQTGSVLFYYNDDVELWDAIEKAKEQETAVTLATALRMFESHANGHILVKLNYGAQAPDCVLRYEKLADKVLEEKNKKKNAFDPELEAKKARYRQRYERLLLEKGFILENGYGMAPEERFVKVYAPFAILCIEAQEIGLRMRLKEETKIKKTSWIRNVIYGEESPKYSSAPFDVDRLQEFAGSDIARPPTSSEQVINFNENFFSSAHRTLLVHSVMSLLKISKNWKEKHTKDEGSASTLMGDLLKREVYTKWFFLHDGDYEEPNGGVRAMLYRNWVWSPLSYQPLDLIRGYFGEKVALYFAWLGYYTYWLALAAVVGTGVFIYGVIRAQRKEGDLISNFEVIFDNELSAPFALFMSVWATLFLEYWKRRNARLQVAWDVYDFEMKEQARPGYIATIERVSPITGQKEFVYPHFHKMVKLIISTMVVLISIGIVLLIVGIIIVARPLIRNSFDATSAAPQVITALLSLVLVMVASNLYVGAAEWLTNWENHRTSTQFEDALILKRYLFEFVNYYSSLFYIALIKKWAGKRILNNPNLTDLCGFDGSCLSDLMVQLAIIFVGKQIVGQLVEVGIPVVQNVIRKRTKVKAKEDRAAHFSSESIDKSTPQYVEDEILPEFTSVFDEYNEMVIQFGFCTLFVAAFPLAPLFAFLNNITEIRTDAYKLITQTQRPPALRAQDIGSWETILTLVSHISVPINAFIIAFSSKTTKEMLANWFGSDPLVPGEPNLASQLAFVVVFEHVVFLLKLLFAFLVPDVPADAAMVQSRNEWLYEQYRMSLIPGKLNAVRKIEAHEVAVVDDQD